NHYSTTAAPSGQPITCGLDFRHAVDSCPDSCWSWPSPPTRRTTPPADRDLALLEAQAKAAGAELGSRPNPVPPWEWRHGKGVRRTFCGGRQPLQACLSQAHLPGGLKQERKKPRQLRERGGSREVRLSAGRRLLAIGHGRLARDQEPYASR